MRLNITGHHSTMGLLLTRFFSSLPTPALPYGTTPSHICRRYVRQLSRAVNGDMVAGGPQNFNRKRTKAVELCNERIELMEIEGVGGTCWDTLYAACSYCRSVGDKQLASSFASKAAESARHALGKDSQEYQKYASYIGTRKADAGKKKKP